MRQQTLLAVSILVGALGFSACASDETTTNTGGTGGTGNTGNIGNHGGTGNTGNVGNTGGTGNTGNTGNTGGTGNTGNTGNFGTGNQGVAEDPEEEGDCGCRVVGSGARTALAGSLVGLLGLVALGLRRRRR
jgi:MYXO-CTERM domain-containing protein